MDADQHENSNTTTTPSKITKEAESPSKLPKELKDKSDLKKGDDSRLSSDTDEPKPRIVLTFRSAKPGLKTNMKIVPNEEKHEETMVRRSTRSHANEAEGHDDPTKSESDDATSDTSNTTPKRSVRNRNKEFSENILANAIARKEKSYMYIGLQRHSRRTKPTVKILASKELRVGLDTSNIAKVEISTDKLEEGVQTRRSSRRRSLEHHSVEESKMISPPETSAKKKKQIVEEEPVPENENKRLNKIKKKHLSKLGLQAIEGDGKGNDESTTDSTNTEVVVEHLNDEKELEGAEEAVEEGQEETEALEDEEALEEYAEGTEEEEDMSDEDYNEFEYDAPKGSGKRHTRSTPVEAKKSRSNNVEEQKSAQTPRRSTRLRGSYYDASHYASEHSDEESPELGELPEGDEGTEGMYPEHTQEVVGTCLCEDTSKYYVAPSDNDEPVFCGAVESVGGARVGCSHVSTNGPLRRAGPRAPFLPLCSLHTTLLSKHMACAACGLFCTEGTFYQCSQSHLFHPDCGVDSGKMTPGCPHCGVYMYRWWQPVNRECWLVKVDMNCSNKAVYMPEQKIQCVPTYLTFPNEKSTQQKDKPVIPADLLITIDIQKLKEESKVTDQDVKVTTLESVLEAIENMEPLDKLVPLIGAVDVNGEVSGGRLVHAAARCGHLAALHALRARGADLDLLDGKLQTALMVAILALSELKPKKIPEIKEEAKEIEKTEVQEGATEQVETKVTSANEDSLLKVVRYLIVTGCNVNVSGPGGMTALHMSAQHGLNDVCKMLISNSDVEVDVTDQGGWTPLVWAAENNYADVVNTLLAAHASPLIPDMSGATSVHWAALAGAAAALEALLRAAPVLTVTTHAGDQPLHVAARQGHYACVVILLARGARTDVENNNGELPIDLCTGECQNAIALSMQLASTLKPDAVPFRLLSSDISKGREMYPIPCINEVDDEPLPDFKYVTKHVLPQNLLVDYTIESLQGCACSESCAHTEGGASSCACVLLSVRDWWRGGRLLRNFPHREPPMLFQCHESCGCDLRSCTNSVVWRLSRAGATWVRCEVVRRPKTGWGLRVVSAVLRGSPVCEYAGELLGAAGADARATDSYVFSHALQPDLLQQCIDSTQLCVDAAKYGSAARFINHSCSPNLAPVRVFTDTRDLRLPNIVLFATRDIEAHEELTFDYGDKFWSVKGKWLKCECGSPECRYSSLQEDSL